MAKKVAGFIKLQIEAGKANPAPPIGPALGQKGVNIMAFCQDFNAKTKDRAGSILPTVITVYNDKSFTFVTKSPPAATQLLKAAGLKKGSQNPLQQVGSVTFKQVRAIAENKLNDLNAYDLDAAVKIISGTARSMGILVEKQEK